MGEIADTMRSALRELAQADARLYRGPAAGPERRCPPGALRSAGIKVPKRPRKDLMVGLLLADPNGPPPLFLLPPPKTKASSGGKVTGATGGKAGTAELQALEQRFVRLEHLVLLIAQQVGVAPEAIERLLPPAAPPT
jgi:hypothetical protein